jgi:hypothetical protein
MGPREDGRAVMSVKDKIAEALFEALRESSPGAMRDLMAVVSEYQTKQATWHLHQTPLAVAMLDAVVEAGEWFRQAEAVNEGGCDEQN